tara:strand:- start:1473 stop:2219 length:747 start_codon:yes stop_codon:yes gene_type:complete
MRINSLYRYPIKSLSPDKKNVLEIYDSGRIRGDRIAAFRIGENVINDGKWLKKSNYLSLMHVPELSKIKCKFDSELNSIYFENEKIEININDKERIEFLVRKYLKNSTISSGISFFISKQEEISFHDSEEGYLSLHSIKSVQRVSEVIGDINPQIFRSNIIVDECEFFQELNYVGKTLLIGQMRFQVIKGITRCNAINCNLETAEYKKNILKSLPGINEIDSPTFGIKLKLISKGGRLSVGDEIFVED